ncbi:hypothetical protein F4604DRAFT_1926910 [Suillus subluteus]|nr:hypothetical protein F4604DRAFT_1926910 [Suillus subluteus]
MIFGDLSAYLFVDGQELPEYAVDVSNTPTENRITCWIASEEGKKFGVRWMNAAEQSWSIRATVSVDGVRCGAQSAPPGWVGTTERTHLANDSVTRDFMFSNIELTDDDSMLGDQSSNDIGQIVLKVKTGKRTKTQVHEQSKKACVHRVIDEVPRQVNHRPGRSTSHSMFKLDKRPVTVFVFKYTRLDILQAMGIAPLISKNSSKEKANDHDDQIEIIDGPHEPSSSKDVKPLIQYFEMELQRLRAQLASSEDRKPSRVKLECGVSRQQQTAEPSSSKDVKPLIQYFEMELQRLRAQLASSEDRKPSRVKLECGVSRQQQTATEVLDLTED